MADNVTVGGVNYATDDLTTYNGATVALGTAQAQRLKMGYGDDGIYRDASMAFPLPTFHPDVTTAGSLAALNATLTLAVSGQSSASVQIAGTFVGTMQFETTRDGVTWIPFNAVQAGQTALTQTTTVPGLFSLNVAARAAVRVNMTAFTSGSATVTMGVSHATGAVYVTQILPVVLNPSTATIGAVRPAPAATGTVTSPASAATTGVLLAANAARLSATVFNDSTAVLYLALTATSSLTAYSVQVPAGGFYEMPGSNAIYTGVVSGIWAAANGFARVTELVP